MKILGIIAKLIQPALSHSFNRRKSGMGFQPSPKARADLRRLSQGFLKKWIRPTGLSSLGVFEKNVGQFIHIFGFILFFLLQSTPVFCEHDSDNFSRGNSFFVAGRYGQACDAYEKIEHKSFAVLYNLGLSYLHKNKQARAMLCCKRAEQQANFKQLTQLYELYDYMHHQIDPDFVPGWYEQVAIFVKKCILSISMLLLQLLLLLAMLVCAICLHKQWYPKDKKLLIGMIFLYVTLVTAWLYKTDMMQQKIGIVTKDAVNVFAGPDASFYKKAELHEADEVAVIALQKGYCQIRAPQIVGWMCDKDIELV